MQTGEMRLSQCVCILPMRHYFVSFQNVRSRQFINVQQNQLWRRESSESHAVTHSLSVSPLKGCLCVWVCTYPCEVHAQFELGEQVEDYTSLVIQHSQFLFLIVFSVCSLLTGVHCVCTRVLLEHRNWLLTRTDQEAQGPVLERHFYF